MPSPFSNKPADQGAPGIITITNSTLVCEFCFEESSEGRYLVEKKILTWDCPCGERNVVKGIEL